MKKPPFQAEKETLQLTVRMLQFMVHAGPGTKKVWVRCYDANLPERNN